MERRMHLSVTCARAILMIDRRRDRAADYRALTARDSGDTRTAFDVNQAPGTIDALTAQGTRG